MKKIISFLLALLMPICAGAETLSQQLDAPEHVTASYASNTGKTVIEIDAPVYIPETNQMYLIPVESMPLEDDIVTQVYELMWPGTALPEMKIDDEKITYSVEGKGTFKGYGKHTATLGERAVMVKCPIWRAIMGSVSIQNGELMTPCCTTAISCSEKLKAKGLLDTL